MHCSDARVKRSSGEWWRKSPSTKSSLKRWESKHRSLFQRASLMRWMVWWGLRSTEFNQHILKYAMVASLLWYFRVNFKFFQSKCSIYNTKSLLKQVIRYYYLICHKVNFYRTTSDAGKKDCQIYLENVISGFLKEFYVSQAAVRPLKGNSERLLDVVSNLKKQAKIIFNNKILGTISANCAWNAAWQFCT